eukprot:TRINITY_DN1951_c0_g1_i1.p1 TRINITY_DN1951_c0_g1~~TRINITY_DN1951_c0_g1_i1.p1  ORF type:complete len:330 (+),score=46.92 TRINITY_DN1951_c0_g1_i1:228-1217(+)
MAATASRATLARDPALSRDIQTLAKSPPHLLRLSKHHSNKNLNLKSELRSFERSHQWSLETDRLHVTHNSSSSPMSASATMDSASKGSKKICLFYCAETKALADRVAAESDAIELRNINWRTFDDGFPNLFISNAHGIRGQHVAFLASFSSPGVIFEQLSIIYALPRMFISSFTLVLPFFPTGSSERMEEEGDIATAFTLARILSNIPISRGGPTSLVIFDIHALQERFYFGENVLPCFESGVPLLKSRLQQLPDSDNDDFLLRCASLPSVMRGLVKFRVSCLPDARSCRRKFSCLSKPELYYSIQNSVIEWLPKCQDIKLAIDFYETE